MQKFIYSLFFILLLSSCVTQKEYNRVLDQYLNAEVEKKQQQLSCDSFKRSLQKENTEINYQLEKMTEKANELVSQRTTLENEISALNKQFSKSKQDYLQQLQQSTIKDQKTNADLIQMQLDLEKQKFVLDKKEFDLLKLTSELSSREQKIKELESLLAKQQTTSELLKEAVKNALTNFSAGDLNVHTKNGKVYVSMSDKLLFKSGSTQVETLGIEALGKLSDVIKKNPDIEVTIEGHTDNIPYLSNGSLLKDNWDLSLMRSSAVLHILLDKYKVNPKQVTASGKGEFFPIELNSTPEGRAKNRRTEIILIPKIDQLIQLLGQ